MLASLKAVALQQSPSLGELKILLLSGVGTGKLIGSVTMKR